jgi:hypothetical protein
MAQRAPGLVRNFPLPIDYDYLTSVIQAIAFFEANLKFREDNGPEKID